MHSISFASDIDFGEDIVFVLGSYDHFSHSILPSFFSQLCDHVVIKTDDAVTLRTWSQLSQSASTLTCLVWAPFLPAEDEDEVFQVHDEYFHLVEFHSRHYFSESSVSWLSSILSLSDLQLRG